MPYFRGDFRSNLSTFLYSLSLAIPVVGIGIVSFKAEGFVVIEMLLDGLPVYRGHPPGWSRLRHR